MVDMFLKNGSLKMMLTISVYGTWRPEYQMILAPLNIDRVDILEALLRDAQEEIIELRRMIHGSGASTGQQLDALTRGINQQSQDIVASQIELKNLEQPTLILSGKENAGPTNFLLPEGHSVLRVEDAVCNIHENAIFIQEEGVYRLELSCDHHKLYVWTVYLNNELLWNRAERMNFFFVGYQRMNAGDSIRFSLAGAAATPGANKEGGTMFILTKVV
jgi:hypothetical protein